MKAGRPAYHVRSKWLTVVTKEGIMYFELDKKGTLVSRLGKNDIAPHHVSSAAQAADPPTAQQAEQPPQIAIRSPSPADAIDLVPPTDDFFGFQWNIFMEATEYRDIFDLP
jgi:hypothetical protein